MGIKAQVPSIRTKAPAAQTIDGTGDSPLLAQNMQALDSPILLFNRVFHQGAQPLHGFQSLLLDPMGSMNLQVGLLLM